MLWTDADAVTATDLAEIDGEILKNVEVNSALGVTLMGPGSIIRNTMEECGAVLTARFQAFSGYLVASGTNAAITAAISNTGNTAVNRPRLRLATVVVLEPDPTKVYLRDWIRYSALEKTFRAVFRRFTGKDFDRYTLKVADYQQEARKALSRLCAGGLPAVISPLDAPGAIRQYQAGTFAQSNVTAAGSGSSDTGGVWYVAITYTAAPYVSPSNNNNAESAGSAVLAITTVSGQVISVSLAGLNPPNGLLPQTGTADGIYSPMAATGWNIYVGPAATALCLQNNSPLPLGTTSFTLPNQPVTNGNLLGPGQFSSFSHSYQNVITRS